MRNEIPTSLLELDRRARVLSVFLPASNRPQYIHVAIHVEHIKHNNMTPDQQIEELLRQLPKQAKHRVVDFLRVLANNAAAEPTQRRRSGTRRSVADRSFGMIPADPATVRRVLCEDPYELE